MTDEIKDEILSLLRAGRRMAALAVTRRRLSLDLATAIARIEELESTIDRRSTDDLVDAEVITGDSFDEPRRR